MAKRYNFKKCRFSPVKFEKKVVTKSLELEQKGEEILEL